MHAVHRFLKTVIKVGAALTLVGLIAFWGTTATRPAAGSHSVPRETIERPSEVAQELKMGLLGSPITRNKPVAAATPVTSDITANTTWTKAGSPYEVRSQISVRAGVTLTIEAGVEVQFAQNTHLEVGERATVKAEGTAQQPIIFTGTTKQPGSWLGLRFNGTAQAPAVGTLSYVTIEYGGPMGFTWANVYIDDAQVTISHSVIRNGGQDGIFGGGGGRSRPHLRDQLHRQSGLCRSVQ